MTMLRYYKNGPTRALAAPIANPSDVSILVDSAASWPTQYPYTLIIDPDGALEEAVDVTAASGNTLTVVRGVDGTTASAHAVGVRVVHGVTARDFREANEHVNAVENVHGTTGALVDTDSDQTVTGDKTFTGVLATAAGPVVTDGGTQVIDGAKEFAIRPTVTSNGDVVTVGGAQTMTGKKTFGNIEVDGSADFDGPETHDGSEIHNGNEEHHGTVTFDGTVSVGGSNISGQWNDWTPVRRNGPGGATLGMGTGGSTSGRYKVVGGKWLLFEGTLIFGSSPAVGTTDWVITIPFAPHATHWRWAGTAFLSDASAGKEFHKGWRTIGGSEIVIVAENGDRVSGAGGGSPFPPAAGDEIFFCGFYELP